MVENPKDYFRLLNSGLVLLVSGLYICYPGGLFDFAKYQKHKNILVTDDDRGTLIQLRDTGRFEKKVKGTGFDRHYWGSYQIIDDTVKLKYDQAPVEDRNQDYFVTQIEAHVTDRGFGYAYYYPDGRISGIPMRITELNKIDFEAKNSAPSRAVNQALNLLDAAEVSAMVYISKDSGNTWVPYANGLPQDATVSCFKSFGKKVIASTEFHGIYLDDGSNHWESITGNLPQNIQIKAVEVMDDMIIIGTTKHGIFRSGNAGKSWTQESSPFNNVQIRCLMQHDGILFAGINLGIYQSLDTGKTWMHSFGNVQINGFAQSKDKFYAGLVNGAVMSKDRGATWKYIYQPSTLHDISSDGRYVYAMTLGVGLLKSADDGENWENANGSMGTFDRYTFEVKSIGNKLFAAQWTGIYRSVDRGNNWELVTGGLPANTAFTTLEPTPFGVMAGCGLRRK